MNEPPHSRQHSWIQRTVAFLIMVNPVITDTAPNLINSSAISFDGLVDPTQSCAAMAPTTKYHLHKKARVCCNARGNIRRGHIAFLFFWPIRSEVVTAWGIGMFKQTFCPSELSLSKTLFLIMAMPEVSTCNCLSLLDSTRSWWTCSTSSCSSSQTGWMRRRHGLRGWGLSHWVLTWRTSSTKWRSTRWAAASLSRVALHVVVSLKLFC